MATMNSLKNSTAIARPSIFSALVGPRICLAPDDGGGNGGNAGGDGGAGGAAAGGDGGGAAGGGGAGDGAAGAGGEGGASGGGEEDKGGGKSLLAEVAAGAEGGDAKAGDEGKSDDGAGKSGEGEGGKDDGPKDVDGNAVPETYEIKMPDGVKMDEEMLAAVTPMLREAKFSPAQAQAAAEIYMQQQTKALEAHAEQSAKWMKDAKEDKEIGGASFAENMGHARKAFLAFGSERAVQIVDHFGLGNHPDVLRMFVRIGKAIGEGGTVRGGDSGGRVSAARDMYPTMENGGS